MGRGNGNGHQQAAPTPVGEKTIGKPGYDKLVHRVADVAEATGHDRKQIWNTVREMAAQFGRAQVADMTVSEAAQVEAFLSGIEPAEEPDIFGGEDAGSAARLQPTTGGE